MRARLVLASSVGLDSFMQFFCQRYVLVNIKLNNETLAKERALEETASFIWLSDFYSSSKSDVTSMVQKQKSPGTLG